MRLAVAILLLMVLQDTAAFRVVCVYTNWAQYRQEGGKFLPEDVDPALCTHIIYVYAKLNRNKLTSTEWNDDGNSWSDGMYDRVNKLKQLNPDMKTLLGVGGWNMGSKDFSKMASGRVYRRIFARSAVKFLRDRNFDGLTIDWQHPTKRGGRPKDRINFSLLLQELRQAFDANSRDTGLPALLLTAGVSASQRIIEDAYEVDNITKYTDFINVFAYDLHGSWENFTGHPSQLYARDEETGPLAELNVDASMRYWMAHVTDRNKLNLGISTSGRTFTLADPMLNGVYAESYEPGLAGDFTQTPGMLAYYERCFQYMDATRVWDDASKSAYWYSGDQWIAGEDEESVKHKVHWMRYNNIGGIMLNSLDMDDFSGIFCNGDIHPIMLTIHEQISAPLPPNPYKGRAQRTDKTLDQSHGLNTTMELPLPAYYKPKTPYVTTPATVQQPYPTTAGYYFNQEPTTTRAPQSHVVEPIYGPTVPGQVNYTEPGAAQSQQPDYVYPEYLYPDPTHDYYPQNSNSQYTETYTDINQVPDINTQLGYDNNSLNLSEQINNPIAAQSNKDSFGSVEQSQSKSYGTVQNPADVSGSVSQSQPGTSDSMSQFHPDLPSSSSASHYQPEVTGSASQSSAVGSASHVQSEKTIPGNYVEFTDTASHTPQTTTPRYGTNNEIIIEPVQETKLRTLLKDAASLPTHSLINSILGILALDRKVTARVPVTTTTSAPLRTTPSHVNRPKSRVHAVLPISILRSFKGPISLFGGSEVMENRPIRQGVTNIWDDPYAQQFLRNSRTFSSHRSAPTRPSTTRPPTSPVFTHTGFSNDNTGHFTNPNMGSTF